jgi:4-amino-4-deoxy-L-arabinose transferase-like glycosyltransferase
MGEGLLTRPGDVLAAGRSATGARPWSRLWRLDPRPWWSWAGLGAIAVFALVLFVWGLSRNGMGNAYYAAAVKSGSVSWKAFFFGSLDPGSFVTVDKPPASLWVQELSVRLFGFSSWSIFVPQALAGVGSILILYRLVRRWQGDVAGLLAALALVLTPVAVVMFRFNNPDAFLTLLLLAAAWALSSALEKGSTRKLVLCGAFIGFAFLTKMLEALVVLPAFALVYMACAPPKLGRRLLQMLAAGAALVAAGGWWIAIVALWPSAARPYIGGTSDNSVLGLVFSRTAGYFGNGAGSLDVGGASGLPNFSGSPGWLRIFNAQLGGQISWLVPLALVGLGVGLWVTLRARRTDRSRAGYLLWGGWMLLYLAVFSMAKGVLHPYYTVVLAPPIAALVGAGCVAMWRLGRARRSLSWLLPAAVLGTAILSALLLRRTRGYVPGLAPAVVVIGLLAAVLLGLAISRVVKIKVLVLGAGVLATACVLAGPAAYSVSRISRSVTGLFAAAGPVVPGGPAGGGPAGAQPSEPAPVDRALVGYLLANRSSAEFLVAVEGAQPAEPIIIDTGRPVMTLRGFSGTDPWPTLAQFQGLVTAGKVRYALIAYAQNGSGVAAPPGSPGGHAPGGFADIQQWVTQHGTAVDPSAYGGALQGDTLYQLW